MAGSRFADLAATSQAVAGTSARSAKVALLAERLAALAPDEVAVAVAYLSGDLPQRRTGLGYAALRDLPAPAATPSVTIGKVDRVLTRIAAAAGSGSAAARRELLLGLLTHCTADEQRLLIGLVAGEVRQGALGGVMVDAVARAAVLPVADVRRAAMLHGSLPAVAQVALGSGAAGLATIGLRVGRPLQPMLASPSDGIEAALARLPLDAPAAVEWKLDGVRLQVHRDGDHVAVYTRSLDDVTARLPEVVAAVRELPVTSVVLDGEAIAVGVDGRPLPFQETASRAGSSRDPTGSSGRIPLTPYFFDVLHLDGADLLDAPLRDRAAALAAVVPERLRVPRLVTGDPGAAAAFLQAALAAGHEGVVVKSPAAPYEAGRRGAAWLKVKPRHTLDLVVLAAEWGHGRRRGWLSNLHLGAADPAAAGGAGGWVMLGKTFKGLTDAMLAEQTERLLAVETARTAWAVQVRPEFVVEVAFDGVQRSPRYPGGVALRFARVLRFRPDKSAAEVDTIDTVRRIHLGRRSPAVADETRTDT